MLLRLRFQSGVEFRRNVLESDRRHVGSVMDAKWTPATVRGFGAVFTDVDRPDGSQVDNRRSRRASTFIEYYDAKNNLIFRGIVPPSPGTRNMSFFGIVFDNPVIARVRIITGNSAPGPNDGRRDIVMMDYFI